MPEVDYYTTSDMGLVGYLRMQVGDPQKIAWSVGTCKWSFILTDSLTKIIETYHNDEAFVNPRDLDRAMNKTRREFYRVKLEAEARGL